MKILYALLTYLMGSLPTGYIFFLISEKKDIRDFGSHSTGATNIFRLKGWKFALPVLAIDLLKGAIPVFIASRLFQDQSFSAICAFLVVAGHCFPVYLRFRGGKGVATTVGVYSVLAFKPFLLSLAVFVLVVLITRYVSLASLLSIVFFPLLVFLFQGSIQIIILGIAIFALIALRHWENIGRLVTGTERKIGESTR